MGDRALVAEIAQKSERDRDFAVVIKLEQCRWR
jgi:hypothetical protein